MKLNHFRIYCAISILLVATLSCSLPYLAKKISPTPRSTTRTGAGSATPSNNIPTMLTATIAIEPSSTSENPTQTVSPTESISVSATPAVGVFASETVTTTPEPVTAELLKGTTCRIGPGPHYDLVATYPTGTSLLVIARDLGGGFIFVSNPKKLDELCYILAANARVSGDSSLLPKFTPRASPTSAPNFSVVFKKYDQCKGQVYLQMVITNTGSLPFRSAFIKARNLKTGESTEKVADAFDLTTGCVIAKNIAPLAPGGTGYLSSEPFSHSPKGQKIQVIVQACTEKGNKGFCVNTVLEVKP